MRKEKKTRGAQPGNQNALKHGFYAKVLQEADKMELSMAAEVEGLDEEIAVLRLKLRQLIEQHPERVDLHMNAAGVLARLIRIQHQLTPEQHKGLKEAIKVVLRDVAVPLGVKVIEGHL